MYPFQNTLSNVEFLFQSLLPIQTQTYTHPYNILSLFLGEFCPGTYFEKRGEIECFTVHHHECTNIHSHCVRKYFNPCSHPVVPFLFRYAHFLVGLIEKYLQEVDSQAFSCSVECKVEEKLYRQEHHFNTHLNTVPNSIIPNYVYIVALGHKNPHTHTHPPTTQRNTRWKEISGESSIKPVINFRK